MTLEREQDLVFDAEGWEAERFIAEVIRAERGLFPMRKRDPETNELVWEEREAIQIEWENLSRPTGTNLTDTYELKRGVGKLSRFMRACQELGLRSLREFKEQRYYEVERRRENLGTARDGREIFMIYTVPIRLVAEREAKEARRRRDLVGVEEEFAAEVAQPSAKEPEAVEESTLSLGESLLLSMMDNRSEKALIVMCEDDPAIASNPALLEMIRRGEIQKSLEKRGLVKMGEDGRWHVITSHD